MRRLGKRKMKNVIQLIGIGFIITALCSSYIISQTAINYIHITEAELNCSVEPSRVQISDLNASEVVISVLFNVSNPSPISIFVYDLTYNFEIAVGVADGNLYRWQYIGRGMERGETPYDTDKGVEVSPRSHQELYVNLTVRDRSLIDKLNHTFSINGMQRHVCRINGAMFYRIGDFEGVVNRIDTGKVLYCE